MLGKISIAKLSSLVSFEHLAEIRRFVTAQAASAGLKDEQVDRLELAVVEFVTNVIRHAKGLPIDAKITLELTRDDVAFWCSISYPGDGYTPPEPGEMIIPPDEYPEGGFGNFIIFSACDSVSFEYVDGQNITFMEIRYDDAS
jgi:anti-sigma regulatory factor (Ser/Thr protein kinase)